MFAAAGHARPVALEPLEGRALFAAVAAAVSPGGMLAVVGTGGADAIRVSGSNGITRVEAGGQVVGDFVGVRSVGVDGGDGDDQLVANVAVPVRLDGGAGADSLTAICPAATLVGGAGTDAFWTTATTSLATPDLESAEARGVNRLPAAFSSRPVPATQGKAAATHAKRRAGSALDDVQDQAKGWLDDAAKAGEGIVGAVKEVFAPGAGPVFSANHLDLPDPAPTWGTDGQANFSDNPLFSEAGPAAADITQGGLADCYVLASLAAVADTSPEVIRQSITELGDGTYAVRMMKGKTAKFVQVDADLPLLSGGGGAVAYADLGAGGSLWVPLMEKAFAAAAGNNYGKLDRGGWMTTTFAALGVATKTIGGGALSPVALTSFLATQLAAGKPVTLGTRPGLPPSYGLVPAHAYTVTGVAGDLVTLLNPWDGSEPQVVAAKTLAAALSGVVAGK